MKRVDHVAIEVDGGSWSASIGYMSKDNTIVFEASQDDRHWEPINGRRVSGPGPKVGSVITCAVAGGPAVFRGTATGVRYLRARLTRHNGESIAINLMSGDNIYDGVIGQQDTFMYVIEEESTLEDLLSE